jgi:hypothetical protein
MLHAAQAGNRRVRMAVDEVRLTGGCLCGALRYEAVGDPLYMGLCCCDDCRKASGSGFIPFIGVAAERVRFKGETVQTRAKAARGGESTRNHCARCRSLVFGGVPGESTAFTLYAGSLDDPSAFQPQMVIFASRKPDWVVLPPGLAVFEKMPPG